VHLYTILNWALLALDALAGLLLLRGRWRRATGVEQAELDVVASGSPSSTSSPSG
jgi:hypothetical protein